MNGIFVTGTGTGVGKTIVAASLIFAFRKKKAVTYWKPVQTGIEEDNDTETVKILANCNSAEIFDKGFRLKMPLSPHLSAQLANMEISVEKVLQFLEKDERFWIVEGAGGILVPLNETETMVDLIKALNLPVLIVAQSGLGTINHTLLTIEALRNRKLEICGVIMNGDPNEENKKAIEHFGKTRVLAQIPIFENISFKILDDWLVKKLYLPQIVDLLHPNN